MLLILSIYSILLYCSLVIIVVIFFFFLIEGTASIVQPTPTTFLRYGHFSITVSIQLRNQVVNPIQETMLVMKELFYSRQIGVDFGKPCLYTSGNLQSVTGPQKVTDIACVICLYSWTTAIFDTDSTGGMFLCQLAHTLVDDDCIFLVCLGWVKFHRLGDRGVAPTAC